jgi:nucleoside-diphosphate-sugar epimerase
LRNIFRIYLTWVCASVSHFFNFLLHFARRKNFMSKRVVSILGCGWLGKPLGTFLANAGYVVMGSTTKNENVAAIKAAGIRPFVFKVSELLSEEAHPFFASDVLVISLPQGARAGKAEEYVRQIQYVAEAARRGGAGNIILISTTSVYPNLNRVVTEQDADVHNVIVRAEGIVRESKISNTVLRFAGLFGPGRHPGRFLAGKNHVSGANVPVNLIHLDDCIQIIKSVIENNVWNEVLNACSDGHPTRRAFYTNAAVELGLQPPVFSDDPEAGYKIVSNERLKAVLNHKFIHQLI